MRYVLVILALALAGCASIAPAQNRPARTQTPTDFIRLDERFYYGHAFALRYPSGWRVVKLNEAGQPDHVVFVSPDETQTIEAHLGPLQNARLDGVERTTLRSVVVDGQIVTLIGRAPAENWEAFLNLFDRVSDSLRTANAP